MLPRIAPNCVQGASAEAAPCFWACSVPVSGRQSLQSSWSSSAAPSSCQHIDPHTLATRMHAEEGARPRGEVVAHLVLELVSGAHPQLCLRNAGIESGRQNLKRGYQRRRKGSHAAFTGPSAHGEGWTGCRGWEWARQSAVCAPTAVAAADMLIARHSPARQPVRPSPCAVGPVE